MYKRKTLVVVAAVTLLAASASFAHASCRMNMKNPYPITNEYGSTVGTLQTGTEVSLKGTGHPRFEIEFEWYYVMLSERNNNMSWIRRKVDNNRYVNLGWERDCR